MNTRSNVRNNISRANAMSLMAALLTAVVFAASACTAATTSTTYYVDCVSGSDANNGTSAATPWHSISKINATTFSGGDSILFKRGVTCSISVSLHPLGSGSAANPITLGAYGAGALPIIAGSSSITTIYMENQQGWHIQDLEVTGGNQKAIQLDNTVSGQQLTHIRLTNLVVHNTLGNPSDAGASMIQISAYDAGSGYFDDVIVDGVTAYSSNLWQGIQIIGGGIDGPANNNPGQIIVRNSTVYSSGGNGITVFRANNVTIENNVVHDNGNYNPGAAITQTPSGIWVWESNNTVAQFNEVYNQHTYSMAGYDAGGMDFDFGIANTTYQYNYLHDNDGYCISFFGAYYSGMTTDTSVNDAARYNICSNNGHSTKSSYEGEFYFSTWNDGFIDGVQIYNNTTYRNPAIPYAAVYDKGSRFSGTRPRFFMNNIIYSAVSYLIDIRNKDITFDYNLYWSTTGAGIWRMNATNYNTLDSWQAATGFDTHSLFTDPLLNDPTYHAVGRPINSFTLQVGSPAINAGVDVGNMGGRDFYGNTIPQGGAYDIGAVESGGATDPTATPTLHSWDDRLPVQTGNRL